MVGPLVHLRQAHEVLDRRTDPVPVGPNCAAGHLAGTADRPGRRDGSSDRSVNDEPGVF